MEMNMNMQVAETLDSSSDLGLLTDNKLDDVNGGLLFLAAAAVYIGVGAVGHWYFNQQSSYNTANFMVKLCGG